MKMSVQSPLPATGRGQIKAWMVERGFRNERHQCFELLPGWLEDADLRMPQASGRSGSTIHLSEANIGSSASQSYGRIPQSLLSS